MIRSRLSVLALVSFVVAFAAARAFATLNPHITVVGGGIHFHHFWYGIILLVIGGWLGIGSHDERIDRVAAVLFGLGGGLLGDEIGLLLTLDETAYQTDLTYMVVFAFLILASVLVVLNAYSTIVCVKLVGFASRNMSLGFGVFLAALSIGLLLVARDTVMSAVSSLLAATAVIVLAAYLVQRVRMRHRNRRQ